MILAACFQHNLDIARYPEMHEQHKEIDYSDSIARLENSHGGATKKFLRLYLDGGSSALVIGF